MKSYVVGQVWCKVKDGVPYDHRRIRHINHWLAVEFEVFDRGERGFLNKESWEHWLKDAVLMVPQPEHNTVPKLRDDLKYLRDLGVSVQMPTTTTVDHFP
jgi:hypothetical protein